MNRYERGWWSLGGIDLAQTEEQAVVPESSGRRTCCRINYFCAETHSVNQQPIVSVAPIPSAPSDPELIEQLKARLQYAELKIRVMEERLRLVRIAKYGPAAKSSRTRSWSCWNWSPE
jgi:hypothetical protein